MCLEIQAFRLVLTVDDDCKLQQRLWGLPGVFVLRLRGHTRVVTIVIVDREIMKGDIVRRTIAFFQRIEAIPRTVSKRSIRGIGGSWSLAVPYCSIFVLSASGPAMK